VSRDKQEVDGEQKSNKGNRPTNTKEAVDKVIESFEDKLKKGEVKLTTAEYLRLVELRDQHELREIKITWVEPARTESSNNE
jgi:hypothetical protein